MQTRPANRSHPDSLVQTIQKIIQDKNAAADLISELSDRLETENTLRMIKRAGPKCPFETEGLCSRINIRCGERQQFGSPEDDSDQRLPHQCNYRSHLSIKELHVLVVDDEPMIGQLCIEFFEVAGMTRENIDRAEDVEEAKIRLQDSKLENKPYHIILSDIKMKNTTGYQLVQHLIERNFNSRILLMSGYVEETDFPSNYLGTKEILPGRLVVSEFFRKPINLTDFTTVVRKIEAEFQPTID